MNRTLTEAEWVYQYVERKRVEKNEPLPVVLGTSGTWTGNGKPIIILIAFTIVDVLVLADIHGVSHHPVRTVKINNLTYYAVNVIDKKQIKEIIASWQTLDD